MRVAPTRAAVEAAIHRKFGWAASLRNPGQLTECLLAGADILTVPAALLATVTDHPLSDGGMKGFVEDSKAFGKSPAEKI